MHCFAGIKAKEALAAKIGKAQVQCEQARRQACSLRLGWSGQRVSAHDGLQCCSAEFGQRQQCSLRKAAPSIAHCSTGASFAQKNRDKYGRIVGVCSIPEGAGRQDLNAWMVQEGYAVAYRRAGGCCRLFCLASPLLGLLGAASFGCKRPACMRAAMVASLFVTRQQLLAPCRQYGKDYVPLEEAAQAAKRGIWSGTFELPAKWRQSNPRSDSGKAAAAAAAPAAAVASAAGSTSGAATAAAAGAQPPPGCAIKGNITAKGEKIYHVPGARCMHGLLPLWYASASVVGKPEARQRTGLDPLLCHPACCHMLLSCLPPALSYLQAAASTTAPRLSLRRASASSARWQRRRRRAGAPPAPRQ